MAKGINKPRLMKAIVKRISLLCKVNRDTSGEINIGKLCQISGVPQSTISSIMTGKTEDITLSVIYKLCKAQGVTLSEFFHNIENEL